MPAGQAYTTLVPELKDIQKINGIQTYPLNNILI